MIVNYHPYEPIDITDTCSICRDDLSLDKAVAHVGLGRFLHPAHVACLKDWFEIRKRFPACPVCMIRVDARSFYQLKGITRIYTDIYHNYSLLSRNTRSNIRAVYILGLVILNHCAAFIYRLRTTGKSNSEKAFYLTSYLIMALSSHYLLKPDMRIPAQTLINTGFIQAGSGGEFIDWALFVCIVPSTIINVAGCFAKIDSVLLISATALAALVLLKIIAPPNNQ